MAYCKNCGNQIEDQQIVCNFCGSYQQQAPQVVDNGGIGWGLLGCCIPLVGLILFLVWKDTKPKSAKAAGVGALVSVIITVIYYVLMFAVGFGYSMM